jgi:hypothetical protein
LLTKCGQGDDATRRLDRVGDALIDPFAPKPQLPQVIVERPAVRHPQSGAALGEQVQCPERLRFALG